MEPSLIVQATRVPNQFRAPDGRVLTVPAGWACLPPGDAGLTRRVKAAGPTWTVQEKVGRKLFSRGVWAPAGNIEAARTQLEAERATPQYAKKLEAGQRRREREQAAFQVDFEQEVREFLAFAPEWAELARGMAKAITEHATPVGSGTVARTQRLTIDRKAEAAVIAWMRHQTTAYDSMHIPRVKGMRREVRRELVQISRALLDLHRTPAPHAASSCPLCKVFARAATGSDAR